MLMSWVLRVRFALFINVGTYYTSIHIMYFKFNWVGITYLFFLIHF